MADHVPLITVPPQVDDHGRQSLASAHSGYGPAVMAMPAGHSDYRPLLSPAGAPAEAAGVVLESLSSSVASSPDATPPGVAHSAALAAAAAAAAGPRLPAVGIDTQPAAAGAQPAAAAAVQFGLPTQPDTPGGSLKASGMAFAQAQALTQERLLAEVGASAQKQMESGHLPADFKVQLQLLQTVTQQGKLLQKLIDRQEDTSAQLAAMKQQIEVNNRSEAQARSDAELLRKVEQKVDLGMSEMADCQRQIAHHLEQMAQKPALPFSERPLGGVNSTGKKKRRPQQRQGKGDEAETESAEKGFDDEDAREEDEPEKNWCAKLVANPYFDFVTGSVITLNAVVIGVQSDLAMQYALENPGKGEGATPEVIEKLGYFFVVFYAAELILKMCAWTPWGFVVHPEWRWNIFDLSLVLLAVYEVVAQWTNMMRAVDVTWLRLLRLLKMAKMLRVVRVMRFFRELRMMLSSIVGSMSTLGWSIMMLTLIMYLFGLVFLQAVSGFLNDVESIDEEIELAIKAYWSSVILSTITLYMAITGGNDWGPLAEPLKECGWHIYGLFLFFIAFAAIAVLNVLTGMFVDAAMKVAEEDEGNVMEELEGNEQIDNMRDWLHQEAECHSGFITWDQFKIAANKKVPEVVNFMSALEIKLDDAEKVFKMLEVEGHVEAEEFVLGCMKVKGDSHSIAMVSLITDTRRFQSQFVVLMEYVEDQFDEVRSVFDTMGAPVQTGETLTERLSQNRCLPAHWIEDKIVASLSKHSHPPKRAHSSIA